jgi:hypothetical protein
MVENFREFHVGPDPDGRSWQVRFVWLQTAISIRTADAVDVKFVITDGELTEEKVIAMPHALLREMAKRNGHPMNDAWCSRLAALHLQWMIETGEDMEKTLATMSRGDLERVNEQAARVVRMD